MIAGQHPDPGRRARSRCPGHLFPLSQSPDSTLPGTLTSAGEDRSKSASVVLQSDLAVRQGHVRGLLLTNHVSHVPLVNPKTESDRGANATHVSNLTLRGLGWRLTSLGPLANRGGSLAYDTRPPPHDKLPSGLSMARSPSDTHFDRAT